MKQSELKKAYDSGLKMVLWGLESGSKKIMDLINKGVPFETRIDVMRNSANAGIFNFAFIFIYYHITSSFSNEFFIFSANF